MTGGGMNGKTPKLPVVRPDARYEVGYGKPPVGSRFQPGRSGNPKGRPKGSKNKRPALNEERLKGIIIDEAYREITVRDGNRNVTVPMAQAIVRALAVNAAKGHHRAQRLFAEMLTVTERQNKALADEWFQTAVDYKAEWDHELDRRRRHGITNLPDPLPHPDQVKIDMNTGLAWVQGPMTSDQLDQLRLWEGRRDELNAELEGLWDVHAKAENDRMREIVEQDIDIVTNTLTIIDKLLEKIGY